MDNKTATTKLSFTLIEILVSATIIALLATVGLVSYVSFSQQSRDARRKADLEQIRTALEMYRSNVGSYPTLITFGGSLTYDSDVYLQKIPQDPKPSSRTYYYSGSSADYTLGAGLERGGTVCVSSGCIIDCNYCLGPLGEK